ncbi:hypothetical protein B8V81_2864 [Paenibacillus pasadenensis]|uniref:Uncharacterized protein n=1 Tax=Paenibacillus pasadenensis TaxID=217090 RepID=A0A2N5N286_9BACL|nr:hypothetical protein B8V81_2864 [Paenibacillus pasadenensis]
MARRERTNTKSHSSRLPPSRLPVTNQNPRHFSALDWPIRPEKGDVQ